VRPDVALVSPYPPPGRTHDGTSGVASYTANLARALSSQGASVLVVAPDEPNAPSSHSDAGVGVVRCGPPGPLALTRAIRLAAGRRSGVIHLQHEAFLFGGLSSLATLPVAMRLLGGRAAATTIHQVVDPEVIGPGFMAMHRLHGPKMGVRAAINAYQRVLAAASVTIVHEQGFLAHLPGSVVIPHGVERRTGPLRAIARQRLGLSEERRLVVLCFGFVAPYKGLEIALAAAGDVPEALIVVAGGDHPRHGAMYAGTLMRRWSDLARFTGWVPEEDISFWHRAADLALFAYPAPHSSSGAVAMAFAHGTPVLTSDELGRCMGLPSDSSVSLNGGELAERLRRLARDRDSLAELRRVSIAMAGGRSWPEMAKLHLRLYDRIVSDEIAAEEVGQLEVV